MADERATGPEPRHLDVFPRGSLERDGRRRIVHPADVSGRFTRARYLTFLVLGIVYVGTPWLQIGGAPAVFLDIERRRFHLFGASFNAQDTWLLFFLLTAGAFWLIFITTLLGRIWCGYACPQTVFLEGVFRRIERWIEGPGHQREQRNRGKWSWDKLWRKLFKHALFVLASAAIANVFISYFVSLPSLFAMMKSNPADHPEAFVWMASITAFAYFNFSWFREQLCLVVCPYGRLQSALLDADTRLVVYDERRGEPRGKAKDPGAADCVDCGRCVAVCPTAIDIRNGTQLECVGCAACVDACDGIMKKLGRAPGLIRYASSNGLAGKPHRIFRPRIAFYGVMGAVGLVVAVAAARSRQSFEVNLLRQQGAPFVVDGDEVRNAFELHLVNKYAASDHFTVHVVAGQNAEIVLPVKELSIESLRDTHLPVFVTVRRGRFVAGESIQATVQSSRGEKKTVTAPLLGPTGGGS